ncbi:DUF418 domain-containing protein [Shouchella lonarensis]|uniref:DUF418 domain-containing protein n=1 Tax=Shouchella lonarensis TaxID=1464122 RepID=A0A1G6JL83_9BACI|nr:DUF418 domain-containing protein [Shouchella lonarensis]SDC19428.1 uncharacterized protein SAMN05421737_10623 [Shouchella lonarensis]
MNQDIQKIGRINVLDSMRGIALLFILLVHLPMFIAPLTTGSITVIPDILFSMSAAPLFAFLFGVSAAILYNNLRKRQANPTIILLRRMFILVPFGVIHAAFIFSVDILLGYGLAGLILVLFVKLPQKWLLTLSIVFFIYGIVAIQIEQMAGLPLILAYLGYMLPGMYAYRAGLFTHLPKKRLLLWGAACIFLVIGIPVKVMHFNGIFDSSDVFFHTIFLLSCLLVTAGYVFLFLAIGTSEKKIRSLLTPFQSVGRMAFTNYLLQSLIFAMIAIQTEHEYFSGWGLIDTISEIQLLVLGLFVFLLQMVFSHLWLERFAYGPLEWVWRLGTYWRIVPLRKKSVVSGKNKKASQI